MPPETVLIAGSTGNVGISAIHATLSTSRNVLALVRNQSSAKKIFEHFQHLGLNVKDRVTVVEADVLSDDGVKGVVERVRAGELPAFQHVYATVGGMYETKGLLESSMDDVRRIMRVNFESNVAVYLATIPYLLEQKDQQTSFTVVTGAAGDMGSHPLPAVSQGALYSLCYAGCYALKDTNVRFNEVYLAARMEVDAAAERSGSMKASRFAKVYEQLLEREDLRSCRVRVASDGDIDELRIEQK